MVIEQTIEFELREPELPGRTCKLLQLVIFMTKHKIFLENR